MRILKQLIQRLKGLPLFNKIVPFSLSGLTLPCLCPCSHFWSRYVQSIGPGIGIGGQTFPFKFNFNFNPRWFLIIIILFLLLIREVSNLTDYLCLVTPLYHVPTITHVMPPAGKIENIDLFGMDFSFDPESETFRLVEKSITTEDLFNISNDVFDSLNSINQKGYVTLESLAASSHFIRSIEFHLIVLGYERKHLGDSNNTYSL
jgi:hypothetical protein